jgi:cytochrome P450
MDPAFKYKKISTLVPLFASCTRKLISKWERQLDQPIKVEEGLTAVTLDAIGAYHRPATAANSCPLCPLRQS